MRRLLRRGAPVSAAIPRTARMLAVGGAVIMVVAGTTAMMAPPPAPQPSASPGRTAHTASAAPGNSYHRIFLPDLLVIEPNGLGAKQLKKLAKIGGVGNLIAADGAAIKIGRHRVNVLGVDPQQFRSWTPLATASDQRLWTALGRGHFVASTALGKRLKLHPGSRYRMTGGGQQDLIFGGSAPLGVSGIGALVSNKATSRLGLWRLRYQSRSGPASQPWLGPDVCGYLPDWPRRAPRGRSWSWSASSPTTWRSCTTRTSRRRRPRSGSACRWPGRPPPALTHASSR